MSCTYLWWKGSPVATVNNRELVDKLIRQDGFYDPPGTMFPDPRCVKIVEYTNMGGNRAWGLVYENDPYFKYDDQPEANVLWESR